MKNTDKLLEMQELANQLNRHNYYYYTLDEPKIDDSTYDHLYDQLIQLEKETGVVLEDSPTRRVGGSVQTAFKPHTHRAALLSLDKAKSRAELISWQTRIKRLLPLDTKPEYVVELKFDGLTINLTYEGGHLVQAATRGNGETGEAILEQVKTIKSIPLRIDFLGTCEIQGEGLMRFSALEEYNKNAEEPLKNARNAAAGALRNLDPKVTGTRRLSAFFYNVGYCHGKSFATHMETLSFLKENRLPVSPHSRCFTTLEDAMDYLETLEKLRGEMDYAIDGVVIKVNQLSLRDQLGVTGKFPRWAIAYKFEAEEVITTLDEVIWNVGRTGKVTPIARLTPIDIGGVTVRRATLNNWEDILRKKLTLHARVWLRRSNDVIPEIMGRVDSVVNTKERHIEKPIFCPSCGSHLIEKGPNLFCENSLSCRPQLVSRLVHFASRDAMDIEGFSAKSAEQLFDTLEMKDLADLYELTKEELLSLEGYKKKKAENLLQALQKSKETTLGAFIYALGIGHVGKNTAKALAAHFHTLARLQEADVDTLLEVPDIGPIVAESIHQFFADTRIKASIERLLDKGIVFIDQRDNEKNENEAIKGKRFVLTGRLERVTRNEAMEMIEKAGGLVSSSVGKGTDYLVVGEDPGSKAEKAKSLLAEGKAPSLKLIDEAQFLDLLQEEQE